MKRMLLPALLLFSHALLAQKLTYNMSAFGITFGQMVVTKTMENDSTELYTLHAKGYLKVLWMERNDETRNEVRFRHGRLLSSTYKQSESGVTKHWTNVAFDGKQYVVNSDRGKSTFTEAPTMTIVSFYFANPQTVSRIFDESTGTFQNIQHPEAGIVEMKNREGKRSIYRYTNGILTDMEFHISIATVYMVKVG